VVGKKPKVTGANLFPILGLGIASVVLGSAIISLDEINDPKRRIPGRELDGETSEGSKILRFTRPEKFPFSLDIAPMEAYTGDIAVLDYPIEGIPLLSKGATVMNTRPFEINPQPLGEIFIGIPDIKETGEFSLFGSAGVFLSIVENPGEKQQITYVRFGYPTEFVQPQFPSVGLSPKGEVRIPATNISNYQIYANLPYEGSYITFQYTNE